MGHQDVRITQIYTHVIKRGGLGVRSPLSDIFSFAKKTTSNSTAINNQQSTINNQQSTINNQQSTTILFDSPEVPFDTTIVAGFIVLYIAVLYLDRGF